MTILSSSMGATTRLVIAAALALACPISTFASDDGNNKWVATWTTAPVNTWKGSSAPALVNFAFPFTPTAPPQAQNQTLRMILKPDLWGETMRVRLSNTWSTQAVTFGKVVIGLQSFSGATVAGTNRVLTFSGQTSVTVPAGAPVWSDPVHLDWTHGLDDGSGAGQVSPVLEGRNLAISMYIPGSSGPVTVLSFGRGKGTTGGRGGAVFTTACADAGVASVIDAWGRGADGGSRLESNGRFSAGCLQRS